MTTFTREDFEHAARAAGLVVESFYPHYGAVCVDLDRFWNPPKEDGDTLRLAVACGMDLSISDGFVMAMTVDSAFRVHGDSEEYSDHGGDKLKAVRYAVFKRAIAIGKAMLAPDTRPAAEPSGAAPSETTPEHQTPTLFHHPDELPDGHELV